MPIASDNKITVGHKMTQVIDKNRQKAIFNDLERKRHQKSKKSLSQHIAIACSSPSFNHHHGQTYRNFTDQNLASVGWQARYSSGKYFTINAIGAHPSIMHEGYTFKDLNVSEELVSSLRDKFKIERLTNIQYLAINEIRCRNTHNLIVAETGGGKTLAYLLPIIETCIRFKKILSELPARSINQPIGIILVPTRELAFQVYSTLNKLLEASESDINIACDLHPDVITAKRNVSHMKINSFADDQTRPVDILVTLPGQLKKQLCAPVLNERLNSIYLKHIVMDEADTLMDDSFNATTLECLSQLELNLNLPKLNINDSNISGEELEQLEIRKFKEPCTQLSFVSATIPRDMKSILEDLVDIENDQNFATIYTRTRNRLMTHVPQKFMRFSTERRNQHLLDLVGKELKNKHQKRTIMIFSHRTSTAIFVNKFLKENGISSGLLTKNMKTNDREALVEQFFNHNIQVICCTDIASRGWDTLHVNHVINFEMPQFISDYIHRIGRVGRLNNHKHGGGSGLVTSYVTRPYEVDLVRNIERSVRLDIDLHNINSNVKRVYNHKYTPRAEPLERSIKKGLNSLRDIHLSDAEIDELALEANKGNDALRSESKDRKSVV